jgi:hypothetical protein
VKKPYESFPFNTYTSHSIVSMYPGTILFLANSSAVATTMRTAHRASTSPNKVSPHATFRTYHVPCTAIATSVSYTICPVSHHPPVSAFFYTSPENNVSILGELRPKSKFLGNSVSTTMEGENRVSLLGRPEDGGEYAHSVPNFLLSPQLNSIDRLFPLLHDVVVGSRRIHRHHAQHVCPWHSVWENGPRARRYMYGQE